MKTHRIVLSLILILLASVLPACAAPAATGFDTALGHYEAIRKALLADSVAGLAGRAAAIQNQAQFAPGGLRQEIAAAAGTLAATRDLKTAREAFYALSKPFVRWREAVGSKSSVVAYCSMTQKSWLQPAGEIGNPYFGKEMPRCGEVVGR